MIMDSFPEPTWWNGDDDRDWGDADPRGIRDDRYDDPRVDPDLCRHGYRLALGCRDCADLYDDGGGCELA